MRLSDLARMPEADRKAALGEIVDKAMAKPNGGLVEIEHRISKYERRYEVRSDHLIAKLEAGELPETEEIATWLMLIAVRDRVR